MQFFNTNPIQLVWSHLLSNLVAATLEQHTHTDRPIGNLEPGPRSNGKGEDIWLSIGPLFL